MIKIFEKKVFRTVRFCVGMMISFAVCWFGMVACHAANVSAVKNLRQIADSETTCTFAWDPVPGAIAYVVCEYSSGWKDPIVVNTCFYKRTVDNTDSSGYGMSIAVAAVDQDRKIGEYQYIDGITCPRADYFIQTSCTANSVTFNYLVFGSSISSSTYFTTYTGEVDVYIDTSGSGLQKGKYIGHFKIEDDITISGLKPNSRYRVVFDGYLAIKEYGDSAYKAQRTWMRATGYTGPYTMNDFTIHVDNKTKKLYFTYDSALKSTTLSSIVVFYDAKGKKVKTFTLNQDSNTNILKKVKFKELLSKPYSYKIRSWLPYNYYYGGTKDYGSRGADEYCLGSWSEEKYAIPAAKLTGIRKTDSSHIQIRWKKYKWAKSYHVYYRPVNGKWKLAKKNVKGDNAIIPFKCFNQSVEIYIRPMGVKMNGKNVNAAEPDEGYGGVTTSVTSR